MEFINDQINTVKQRNITIFYIIISFLYYYNCVNENW